MLRRCALVCALLGASVASAAEEGWALVLTPYVFLPGVEASMGMQAPDGDPSMDAGPTDVLSLINFAVMLRAEAQSDRNFLLVDWMYLDLGNADSVITEIEFPGGTVPVGASLTLDSDASFDGFMFMAAGGRRVVEREHSALDVYGGLRTLNLSASLRWALTGAIIGPGGGSASFPASGTLETSSEVWDAVLGVRGRRRFADRWQAFAIIDHGWGHQTTSWQAELGVGWETEATRLELSWREIAWQGLGDGGTGSLRLYGPTIGAEFRF